MSDVAIRVENLSKQYQIGSRQKLNQASDHSLLHDVLTNTVTSSLGSVKSLLNGQIRKPREQKKTIWALKDVSFEVKWGEVVGVVGRNGSGKSTLLKILSRITEPTSGEATIYGRTGSLLEVGTGFHPELTGRENVYLSGAILNMKPAQITRKFAEIVAFAELEKFIDTPVKRYSSGMQTRLAFAVAANLEPEILLVDEVLAVGDVQFKRKCLAKMEDAAKAGQTIFLVSHNLSIISALCQRVLYLKDGQIQADGPSQESIDCYLADLENQIHSPPLKPINSSRNGSMRVKNIRWLDAKTLNPLAVVMSGQEVYLEVSYETLTTPEPIDNLEIHISFRTNLDQFVMALNSRMAHNSFADPLPTSGKLYCHLERFPLMPGHFPGQCTIKLNGVRSDLVPFPFTTDVKKGDFYGTGVAYHWNQQGVYVPHRWLSELP